jgi:hypothetical protein
MIFMFLEMKMSLKVYVERTPAVVQADILKCSCDIRISLEGALIAGQWQCVYLHNQSICLITNSRTQAAPSESAVGTR